MVNVHIVIVNMSMKCFLTICLIVCATCSAKQSTIVKRSGYTDQAVSASGYAYQANGNGPISYSSYRIGSENFPNEALAHYSTPGIIQPLASVPLGLHHSPQTNLLNPYTTPVKLGNNYHPNWQQGLQLRPWMPAGYSLPYYKYGLYNSGLIGDQHKYAKGSGNKYDTLHTSSEAAKGEQGYKNQQKHDRGSVGKHLNEGHKEHYGKEGSTASSNQDRAGYHARRTEAANGVKGGSSSESSGHRKGSKTTGYHKVYHKDEYKKDHSFYDESDASGHNDKYEKGHSEYGKEKGAFEKGGRRQNGYEQSDYGAEGYRDQGKYLNEDKGHQNQQTDAAYYKNDENSAKANAGEYQDENGYAVSDDD